jgi:beta-glucosidase
MLPHIRLTSSWRIEWTDFQIDTRQGRLAEDVAVKVSVVVKNTGAVAGAEVVQIYISDLESKLRRPKKELKGFAKVFVEAGRSERVVIELDKYAFSHWDDKEGSWLLEKGSFEAIVAKSSKVKDEVARLQITVNDTHYWNGL